MTQEALDKAKSLEYEIRDFEHLLSHIDKEVTFLTINHHSISKEMMETDISKRHNKLFKVFFEQQLKDFKQQLEKL